MNKKVSSSKKTQSKEQKAKNKSKTKKGEVQKNLPFINEDFSCDTRVSFLRALYLKIKERQYDEYPI